MQPDREAPLGGNGIRPTVTYAARLSVILAAAMTETGLALFVVAAFLLPVPVLVWLDRPKVR